MQKKILIVGVGNTLRGDDGAGAYVCDAIEKLKLAHVSTHKVHQLQTENIELFLQFDEILITDATVNSTEIKIEKISETIAAPASSSHHTNPVALLALVKHLYKKQLNLYTCAIPVENFDMGETLSAFAKTNADKAIERIKDWISS